MARRYRCSRTATLRLWLSRSIGLRNPYVDALSAAQVDLLARLRDPSLPPDEAAAIRAVVGATINGVAAGLQNTG